MEFLNHLSFWHWLLAGLLLISIEMLVLPAAYCLWMGIAAFLVGSVMLLVPDLSVLLQIIIFTVFSVVSLLIHKSHMKNNPLETDVPALNRRGEQYINRVFTLDEAIVNGVGKVKVDDSIWKVSGEDMGAGSRVKVVGVDGTVFLVEAAE